MTREQIIEVIATELSCAEMMHQYDDFTRTVKAGVWASRIFDAIESRGGLAPTVPELREHGCGKQLDALSARMEASPNAD
ncbi:hypothetical protein EVB56_019 [Rhizobium phage RHph_Y1_10]|nr:hypothetical protein EVB56_019 [Rhizobium phage RHph_Y1_10]